CDPALVARPHSVRLPRGQAKLTRRHAMTAPAATKVCIKCGTDCSNKPRTKDPEGRYTCKACYDAMMAKAAAAKVAKAAAPQPEPKPLRTPVVVGAPDDASVMAALLEDSPAAITEACPSCGAGLAGGAVICTICGYNKETGRAVNLKIRKAAKDKAARSGPGLREIVTNTTYTGLGAAVVLGGLFALAFVTPIGALFYILAAALYSFVFGML